MIGLTELALFGLQRHAPTQVISGMALGWDTALAMAAIAHHIPLIAAVPFVGQESRWPPAQRLRYQKLLRRATEVVVVTEGGYAAWKMQKRNEWMVDRCDVLLALWDGSSGGTANCLTYARQRHVGTPLLPAVVIDNLWSEWESRRGVKN